MQLKKVVFFFKFAALSPLANGLGAVFLGAAYIWAAYFSKL
jgi:hypothetical protein